MRVSNRFRLSSLLLLAPLAASGSPFFSMDPPSPTVAGSGGLITESDVYGPTGPPGPPALAVPAAALGLVGGGIDNLDAMTAGTPLGPLLRFSVDRASVGAPSGSIDVSFSAALGQEAGDVYLAAATTSPHILNTNQDTLGLVPAVPYFVGFALAIDDVDAIDLSGPAPMFFSLTAGHPYLGASGAVGCGSDLFAPMGGGPPAPAIPPGAMALVCGDDVDALHVDPGTGDIYFSLAPGSPSLLPGSPIAGCGGGCSPADIMVAPGGAGGSGIFIGFGAIGLVATDNVDAIDLPEPGVALQLVPGVLLLATLRRRKAK